MAETIQTATTFLLTIIILTALTACVLAPVAMEQVERIDQA